MSALAVGAAAAVGAVAGLAAGALGVTLERVERLEEEEAEERAGYEREQEERMRAAAAEDRPPPVSLPWRPEHYGWTPLEWLAAPLLGAAGFAAFTAHEGVQGSLAIHLVFVTLFVHVAVFDIKHRLILDKVSFPAIALALALAPLTPGLTLKTAAVGAVAIFAFFLIQSLVLGGTVLGLGDAKLGAVVGGVTGLGFDLDHLGAVYAVIAAVISAGLVALLLLVLRVRGLKDPIPYGPFLCAGAALIMYHGPAGP